MSQQMQPTGKAPFDTIRHSDEAGEYWLARDLMPMLEYSSWQRFEEVIQRAIEDCAKSGRAIQDNFNQNVKIVGKRGPSQKDYRLTRYACRLIVMAARTSGQTAALARTYFSDQVDEAETDAMISEWRDRAVLALMAAGYSQDWAKRRIYDITSRNELTHEWVIREVKPNEIPILTNALHMGAFGISTHDHKGAKDFPITYKGKKLVYKGDLPPAMTATELALNALASTVSKELHVTNDSHGFAAVSKDVRLAGEIVGRTRQDIERATGKPVVSSRNMLNEPDGGIWAQLPPSDDDASE